MLLMTLFSELLKLRQKLQTKATDMFSEKLTKGHNV